MLVKITSLEIVTEAAFYAAHPNVSFPATLTDEILSPFGYAVLNPTSPPAYDSWTHRLIEGTPEQRDGKWWQTWTREPVTHTAEEEAQRLAEAKSTKLSEIKAALIAAEADDYVESSLGFRASSTLRSIEDIDGLTDLVSSGALTAPVTFRDYDNTYHDLTLDQLNTLRLEAKGRRPLLYAREWELEAAVYAAETVEAVQAIDAGAGWPGAEKTCNAALATLGGLPLIEAGDDGKALVADGETLTWVKGPSFTETPAAGAVPKADASGKLNAWVDVPTPWSPGDIKMWFGELDATGKYPLINGVANTSWHICDGTGGTPDMRDRVPVGASASKAKGTTGGSETHDHAVSVTVENHAAASITGSVASAYSGVSSSTASASTSGTVGSTTLSTSQMPSHNHKLEESSGTIPSGNLGAYGVLIPNTSARGTHATGGSGSHTHSLSGGSHSHSISESTHTHGAGTLKTPALSHSASGAATSTEALPPYVALHFLMYVG